jgi:NADPH:quinone reductase
MQAVTIKDGKLVFEQHPDPVPGTGEVLVAVHAAGINRADLAQKAGMYPAPPGFPVDIPGMELAGEVVALGPDCFRFSVGDRVMAVVGGGAQAEMAVVNERVLMPVPSTVDWTAAGGLPEVFMTAHDAVFTQAGLKAGERLLVHGAAGGVGTAAVQLGVTAGATVTATVRNPDHRGEVAKLGAAALAPEDFPDSGPFDVILELVGAPNWPANIHSLDFGGRITVIGLGGGAEIDLDLGALMGKRAKIYGSTLRARSLEEKAQAARAVERHVLPLFEAERLTVPVAATFPLREAEAAYDRFDAGGKFGKIVLTA